MSSEPVTIDGDAIDILARRRKGTHDDAGNHRPAYAEDSLTAERVGAAAEAAFSIRYGLPTPSADLVGGDDGYDYRVEHNDETLTVEIKASEYADPSLMLSDGYRNGADRYALASVTWPDTVRFVGWIDAARVPDVGTRELSQFGGWMDVVESDDLRPLPEVGELTPVDDDN